MKYLLKDVKIVTPESISTPTDILIESGKFSKIAKNIKADDAKIIESDSLHISIGWMDIGGLLTEPGHEEKETIATFIKSATNGGYTAVAPFPATNPPMDNKSTIQFVKDRFRNSLVDFYPIASATEKGEGRDISEMQDLHTEGIVAFTDGRNEISDSGTLQRTLLYAKQTKKPVINMAMEKQLALDGMVHEGVQSTSLGLEGIPDIAELAAVKKDIDIAHYTEGDLILHNISSAESIAHIKKNSFVRYSIAAMNLTHDESAISNFEPNFKVRPPLRSKKDRKRLVKAVAKGRASFISSNHCPVDAESKDLDFVQSAYGASTMDTVYSSLTTYCKKDLTVSNIINGIAFGPRKTLQIEIPEIKEGEVANCTVFDPSISWTVEKKHILSKSKNNPYIGDKLTGKVIAVFNNRKAFLS